MYRPDERTFSFPHLIINFPRLTSPINLGSKQSGLLPIFPGSYWRRLTKSISPAFIWSCSAAAAGRARRRLGMALLKGGAGVPRGIAWTCSRPLALRRWYTSWRYGCPPDLPLPGLVWESVQDVRLNRLRAQFYLLLIRVWW